MEVRLILRHRLDSGGLPTLEELCARKLGARTPLGHEEFEQRYAADLADVASVREFADRFGLAVRQVDPASRMVRLAGTMSALGDAFGVSLREYSHSRGTCVSHDDEVSLPAELAPIVVAVLGLDTFPVGSRQTATPLPPGLPNRTPPQIAALYDFPKGLDGSGQTIAILALGGGYDPTVLESYFRYLQVPMPAISWVNAGGKNDYDPTDGGLTEEVMVDIEIAGSVAPGARIVVYFGGTDGFVDTLRVAVTDAENRPSVISTSFASPEVILTSAELDAYDQYVREAAMKGITILVASGDTGSNISNVSRELGFIDNLAIANFPTTHPGVIGCGGTSVVDVDGKIVSETVWNNLGWLIKNTTSEGPPNNWGATGGGASLLYPLPWYQDREAIEDAIAGRRVFIGELVAKSLHSPRPVVLAGRGVPDVAATSTGYSLLVQGTAPADLITTAGTSAVAPLWAGLIARINQGVGRPVGFINDFLYNALERGGLRQITRGCNGSYDANPALVWNACTGLGVPDGENLLGQFKAAYAPDVHACSP
jgi:kumamolisin